ncbi:molybdopterin-dependent oxidoreductase [Cryobacterium fucosi]|uniref:Molybdopterin dinucleotide-binding protein n=1 Tax=Cryobacterium fucosi TaxID=1259157 RepID=A0A4R9B584_9MICO|nr:molybdopterin-dependent oxidoreductase [Cryobacterium fucosi]TFD75648.1 molybdopterin dinucleotide-binding protein [Cryobacterium fucosi]
MTDKTLDEKAATTAPEETTKSGLTRRLFLGGTATVGGVAVVGGMFKDGFEDPYLEPTAHGTGAANDAYGPEDVIYTMCMQCNTFCTIKVRLTDPGESGATSLVRKIAGNPYSPLTTQPIGPIPYGTTPADAVKGLGVMALESKSRSGGIACLKGQAGIQTVHDAKRITQPLKRVGPRGSGKWRTITWERALKEVLDGAADIGTTGLKSWWAYAPKQPVMADWAKVGSGALSAAEFEGKWGAKLLDPKRPQLGPKSNLMTILGGDRMQLIGERMSLNGFGSINQFNHGGICGVTGVIANALSHPTTGHKRMYADIDYVEYLIVWGTEPLTAQKGPTWLAPRIGAARERGMKMCVIDPRMSKTAEKADLWVPVKPGHDAALAFAIARWIVDNNRYDAAYLRSAGKNAASAIGEPTWSDATHLVKVDEPTKGKLTMVDIGRAVAAKPLPGGKPVEAERVVLVDGTPQGAATVTTPADLDVDTEVDTPGGKVRVKSVFRLLVDRLREREITDYAAEAGTDAATVAQIGHDFTNHGKRAAVMAYRGPAMHANGFDTVRAIGYLNFLIGNHDWKGGHLGTGRRFDPIAGRYDLNTVPNANPAWGVPITREKVKYEDSPFFGEDGYPAKRPWYPFAGNLAHEVLPSANAGYPYSLNALFMHRHSPLNSQPGARRLAEIMKKVDKIKLVVSFDITMGDSSLYADYVLPDLTYLERFTQESIYPSQQYMATQLGQPATLAFEGPRPVEQFYLDLMKAMGLPGVGKDAFGPGASFDTVEDYWLKMAANVAFQDPPVPDADAEELRIFTAARTKALGKSFDERAWKKAVTPEEWRKVVYVLNRGGRFDGATPDRADGYEGEWLRHRYAGECDFYNPKLPATRNSITGKPFDGLAGVRPPLRSDGKPVDRSGRPLHFITWKSRSQGTHRTIGDAWLREVRPSNFVWVNTLDARARGIESGDRVKLTSATAVVEGIVMVVESIRPGVVGADAAFGHRGFFASAVEIDGKKVNPPARYGHGQSARRITPMHEETGYAGARSEGFQVNALLDDDVNSGGGGINDPIGGGAAQLDTWVELAKVR